MADKKSPPYASTRDIESFFKKIEMLKAPKIVDAEWAKGYLESKQPPAIPTMLEWLDVTRGGAPDPQKWTELRAPDTRRALLGSVLPSAYSDVFDQIEVNQAGRSDLDRAFVKAYGMGDPSKYVNCFLTLCSIAGLPLAVGDTPRERVSPAIPRRRDAQTPSRGGPPRKIEPSRHQVVLSVEIPAEWGPEEIRKRIELVRRALDGEGASR